MIPCSESNSLHPLMFLLRRLHSNLPSFFLFLLISTFRPIPNPRELLHPHHPNKHIANRRMPLLAHPNNQPPACHNRWVSPKSTINPISISDNSHYSIFKDLYCFPRSHRTSRDLTCSYFRRQLNTRNSTLSAFPECSISGSRVPPFNSVGVIQTS